MNELTDKQKQKLTNLGCSFATDYKYRALSDPEQAKRFINYGFTVEQVLKFWEDIKNNDL